MADMILDGAWDCEEEWEDREHVVTCRYCGTKNLTWGMVDGKWRLFNKKGIHKCKVVPLPESPKPREITDPIEKAFYAGWKAGHQECSREAYPEVGMSFPVTPEQAFKEWKKKRPSPSAEKSC